MAPLAFGIVFGNKDTGNWTKFWEFVKEIHPSVNTPTITILTDQDKGSITKRINFLVPITAIKISSRRAGGMGKQLSQLYGCTTYFVDQILCHSFMPPKRNIILRCIPLTITN
jgi:hypothetical protein